MAQLNMQDLDNITLHGAQVKLSGNDPWIIILTILFAILTIGIFSGNCLVVAAVATTRRLKTITNIYVVSLAAADLLVAILVLPASIAMFYTGAWPFVYPPICRTWLSADIVLCTASIYNLLVISIDRYMAVTRPLEYTAKRTKRTAGIMLLIAWTLSFIVVLPPLVGGEQHISKQGQCMISRDKGYRLYSSLISFYIPCVLMLYLYARIFCVSYRRLSKFNRSDLTWKISKRSDNTQTRPLLMQDAKFSLCNPRSRSESLFCNLNCLKRKSRPRLILSSCCCCHQKTHKDVHEAKIIPHPNRKPKRYHSRKYVKHKKGKNHSKSNDTVNSLLKMKSSRSPQPNCTKRIEMNNVLDRKRSRASATDLTMSNSISLTPTHPTSVMNSSLTNIRTFKLCESASSLNVMESASESNLRDTHTKFKQTSNKPTFDRKPYHSYHSANRKHGNTLPAPFSSSSSSFGFKRCDYRSTISGFNFHQRDEKHERAAFQIENKTAITLAYVVGCFSVCWFPFFIMYLSEPFMGPKGYSNMAMSLVTWLGYGNSVFNPFIYAFYNKEYANAFKRILRIHKRGV